MTETTLASVDEILQLRARELARPRRIEAPEEPGAPCLVVGIGGQRYAVEVGAIREVLPLAGVTRVPRTPPCVVGIMRSRSRVLAVIDPRPLFGLPHDEREDGHIVIVEAGDATYGLYVQTVDDVANIRMDALELTAADGDAADQQRLMRGITNDLIVVIDPQALARDPRVIVDRAP